MKRYGALVALVLAVFSGLAAVWLANRWMSGREGREAAVVKEAIPTTKVAIAARDLEVGARLTPEALTLADWPAAAVPRGAFSNVEALKDRVAVTRLSTGQPILAAELAAPGSGAGLVATIPAGRRAMSIRVDEVVGVSGFVLPNTFVDVIAVNEISDRKMKAKILLERIQVLAIAQETFTEEGKPKLVKTVTLEVTPDEARKLAVQTHEGPIHLVLRNPAEEVQPQPEPEKPAPVAAVKKRPVPVLQPRVRTPAPSPYTVEVIRGAKAQTLQFKHADSEERID